MATHKKSRSTDTVEGTFESTEVEPVEGEHIGLPMPLTGDETPLHPVDGLRPTPQAQAHSGRATGFRVWAHGEFHHDGTVYRPGDVVPFPAAFAEQHAPVLEPIPEE